MAKEKPRAEVAEVNPGETSLLAKFGKKYSVDPVKVYDTLLKTAFKEAKTQEQVIALLVVADQYGLNPFTREIFAFPDKKTGAVVPVVGVDGWNRIAQQHTQYDGIEFNYADEMVSADEDAKECPEWVEVIVYRKDRSHPVVIREYLDECYRPRGVYDGKKQKPGHWQTHTKRALRHKTLIQGYRVAFGFHGIYDPDEAARFIDIDGGPASAASAELASPPSPNLPTTLSPKKAGKGSGEQEGGEPPAEDTGAKEIDPGAPDGGEDELL